MPTPPSDYLTVYASEFAVSDNSFSHSAWRLSGITHQRTYDTTSGVMTSERLLYNDVVIHESFLSRFGVIPIFSSSTLLGVVAFITLGLIWIYTHKTRKN